MGTIPQYDQIEWLIHNIQERSLEEHKKLVERIMKRDQRRRKRIEASGIDYDCPEIVGNQPTSKKIRFDAE